MRQSLRLWGLQGRVDDGSLGDFDDDIFGGSGGKGVKLRCTVSRRVECEGSLCKIKRLGTGRNKVHL